MPLERREQVTRIGIVRVNGKPEELDGHDGGRQPSMGGTSRVSREAQARICERLGVRLPGPTHRNIYVRSERAGQRVMETVQGWIEKHLRLQVNATKSGVGRTWERKFLGFRLNRERQIEAAPESVERFKAKVGEKWRSCQSLTSNQLRDTWRQYVSGWWGYYQLAENRRSIFRLEGWIRRHIRKCFWLRWHKPEGRERRLRSLGIRGRMLKVAQSHRGAWHLAGTGSLQTALSNATLRRYGFLMPSDLAGC